MVLRWQTSGYPRSTTQRYTIATPDFPPGEWATDQLSSVYDRAHQGMESARARAHATVEHWARVDTGLMKASIYSSIDTAGERIEITYGWYADAPYYAIFQEFGTRFIRPMHAVHRATEEIKSNWSQVLGL